MKKLYLCIVFILVAASMYAQPSVVTFTVSQPPCNDDGIVLATWTGGTAPFTITYNFWSLGTQVIHSNISGNTDQLTGWDGRPFNVIISDANGDTNDGGQQSQYPFYVSNNVTPIQCPSTPGSISTTVTGGTAPYTYQYYHASDLTTVVSTNNPASVNTEGSYLIRVTDANGCTMLTSGGNAQSDTALNVPVVAPFDFNVATTTASCTNGTATPGTISGSATAPLSYLWSNGSTSATGLTGLTMGGYALTITDANGCHFTHHFEITQSVNIDVNTTITDATCLDNDGAAIAFASGGVSPYTYQWDNGVNTQNNIGLHSGSYNVTATDANGCIGYGYSYVGSTTPIIATYTATSSSCTGATGSATLDISGGQAPYTIAWSTTPAQSGITASNLAPGSYYFNITDANECVRDGYAVIPPQNEVNVSLSKINPICLASDGSITSYVSGTGATPYTYLWSNGATSSNISSLASGYYSVTVTDNDGCAKSVGTHLESQSPVTLGFATTPVTCIYSNDGSITVTPIGGTAPYTYNWSADPSNNSNTLSNIGTGNNYVNVTDAAGCTASGHAVVTNSATSDACYCTIEGTVFNDLNNNCVKDAGEDGIHNIGIHCTGFGYAYTNQNGDYSFQVPTGTYNINELVQNFYPLASCQNNDNSITVTAASGCSQTIDFANAINPIHDMRVSLWNNTFAVPGNTYLQQLEIHNAGTVTEAAAVSSYKDDGQLGAAYFNPSLVFVNSGSNYYNNATTLSSIAPGQSQTYTISHSVPTNIPMGTGLVYYDSVASIASLAAEWLNDYSPWDNVNTKYQTVVSSYDPNFIEVSPQGIGTNGEIEYKDSILTYRVHFQNSGTYYAQNVYVLDSLDENLDWSTFKPSIGSFPFTTTMNENGVVRFQFDNINLPWEDINEAGSQGYATYTVILKPNLAPGTQIHNSAGIYFDYNEPIITNTVVNTLKELTTINQTKKSDISMTVFPNPATNYFTINVSSIKIDNALIVVSDIAGKVLMQENLRLIQGDQSLQMNAAQLSAGIYFVTLKGNGYQNTEKLVIVK